MTRQLEESSIKYLNQHNIPEYLEKLLRELVVAQPENPYEFLIEKIKETPVRPSGPLYCSECSSLLPTSQLSNESAAKEEA